MTWQNGKPLVVDLEAQRRAILEPVASADSEEAHALLSRFMALSNPVFDRCDDGGGTVIGVFHEACADLGALAAQVRSDPEALARSVFEAIQDNGSDQYDGLIGLKAPALAADGLAAIKAVVAELGCSPMPVPPKVQGRPQTGARTGQPKSMRSGSVRAEARLNWR